jgi:hypothetical protein
VLVLVGVMDVALIHYPSCTDSIKPQNLQFSCKFVVINASEGSLCFQIFILHNSRCQVPRDSCKKYFTSVLLYFTGTALLSDENWVPLKPVLGGVRDVALVHYPSCTDSIKPSLQFSGNSFVINASEGSLCFQILIV